VPFRPASSTHPLFSPSTLRPRQPKNLLLRPIFPSRPTPRAITTWLSLTATELEVRQHFKSIPVQTGLETLARMRHQCNLAAETLQGRMDEQNTERCTGCGKTLEECHKSAWLMQGSDMDAETGVPVPYRFCGPLCIRERNRERMLPPEQREKKRFDGQEMGDIL
jgi:ferredoxin